MRDFPTQKATSGRPRSVCVCMREKVSKSVHLVFVGQTDLQDFSYRSETAIFSFIQKMMILFLSVFSFILLLPLCVAFYFTFAL